MSEIKHTPGPWVFDEDECSAIPALHLYCADSKNPFHGSRSEEELKANARLIAAAPALLEVLREITALMEACDGPNRITRKARAAIIQATGTQS